jgi:hypothetical protein
MKKAMPIFCGVVLCENKKSTLETIKTLKNSKRFASIQIQRMTQNCTGQLSGKICAANELSD